MTVSWLWAATGALTALAVYQQFRIFQVQRSAKRREELFKIVAENAADMIALMDMKGRRLYNSPAYKRILGYSPAELGETSAFEQIHPDDRFKVLEAAREARGTGVGKKLESRIRHKSGNWLVLESAASTIRNEQGEVTKLVIVNRDITERKRAEEQLEQNSFHDALTGLPNRRLFLDRLQHLFLHAERHQHYKYAVLIMDIDGFKEWNESLGPEACDQVLVEMGRRLAANLRSDDTIARPRNKLPATDPLLPNLGGDEFTVLLDGIASANDALRIARRLQAIAAKPIAIAGQEVCISSSIGLVFTKTAHQKPEELLQGANVTLTRAKGLGGSRCEIFDEGMHMLAASRLQLENELQAAIRARRFIPYYQPLVELKTKRITGFEALLRWQHPEQGVVSPRKFLDVAEERGLLVTIGQAVILEACKQLSDWRERYPSLGPLKIALNLSQRQLAHPGLIHELKAAMREAGIEPSWIQLEIAENVAMQDAQFKEALLSQLKALGMGLILDDFGSGSSSLSQLRHFPVDALKIDRSLISDLLADRGAGSIVDAIVTVAHKMNLQVMAEGIENAKQLERLLALGCDYGQGRFFSKPLAAKDAEQLIQQQRSHASGAAR
jgi:diguanylate cyclase (GGDEF)-like protein/PAS domain S-box-containing protein